MPSAMPPVFVQMGNDVVHAPENYPQPYFQVYGGSDAHVPSTEELNKNADFLFTDKSIRTGFLRKVFGIFSIQVLFTFSLVALFALNEYVISLLKDNNDIVGYVIGVLLIVNIVCILIVGFQPPFMKKTWASFFFLSIITICMGFSLAIISAFIRQKLAVVYVTGFTLTTVIVVTLFTLQSYKDLTFTSGFLLAFGGVIPTSVIMYFVVPVSEYEEYAVQYLIVGAILSILFSLLWMFIIKQMMFAPSGKLAMSPDQFILAAMYLYIATVLIFLIILATLVGEGRCRGWFCIYFPIIRQEDSERRENVV